MKRYLIKYRKDNGIVKGEEKSYELTKILAVGALIKLLLIYGINHIEIDLIQ